MAWQRILSGFRGLHSALCYERWLQHVRVCACCTYLTHYSFSITTAIGRKILTPFSLSLRDFHQLPRHFSHFLFGRRNGNELMGLPKGRSNGAAESRREKSGSSEVAYCTQASGGATDGHRLHEADATALE